MAGRELDLALIRMLNQAETLTDWLMLCGEAAVLAVQDGRWYFSHDKIREGLLAQMTTTSLRAQHKRVAQGLESLYAERQDYAPQLAYHWRQADNADKERTYVYRAGQLAASQYLNEEASDFFNRAYELTPDSDPEQKMTYLLAQEYIYSIAETPERHSSLLKKMVDLAQRLTDPNLLAEVMVRQVSYDHYTCSINMAQLVINGQTALENARLAGNVKVQSEIYDLLGSMFMYRGTFAEGAHHFELGLTLLKQNSQLAKSYDWGVNFSLIHSWAIMSKPVNRGMLCWKMISQLFQKPTRGRYSAIGLITVIIWGPCQPPRPLGSKVWL